jgi:hypothetical protein
MAILSWAAWIAEPGASSGLHRRQGLNPAFSAAAAEGKKAQFSSLGVRTLQTGLQ